MSALDRIAACGVVPVVMIDDWHPALALSDALTAGGLPVAEITFRTGAAAQAIELLARDPGLTVGAGTILSPADADRALQAGAQFIVSPGFELAEYARHPAVAAVGGSWIATRSLLRSGEFGEITRLAAEAVAIIAAARQAEGAPA